MVYLVIIAAAVILAAAGNSVAQRLREKHRTEIISVRQDHTTLANRVTKLEVWSHQVEGALAAISEEQDRMRRVRRHELIEANQPQGVYLDTRNASPSITWQDTFIPNLPGDDQPVAPGPSVRGDSVRDWVQHYSHSAWDWPRVVKEFYRRAAEIDAVADYFNGVSLERLQQHFTRVVVKLTQSEHLTQGDVRYMAWAHRNVHNSHGEPITHTAFNQVFDLLASVLDDAGVPENAIDELARMVEPLRDALVVATGPIQIVNDGNGATRRT